MQKTPNEIWTQPSRGRLALLATVFALAVAVGAALVITPAQARMSCHDSDMIAKQLAKQYDEAPVAFGLQSNGNLLQVYASNSKGTWTVVSATPRGRSCIVATGNRWEMLPPDIAVVGTPG